MAPTPPVAKREATFHPYIGADVPDLYHWLKDQTKGDKRQEILDYLIAENAYAKEVHLGPNKSTIESVYKEFLAKIQETDQDVPSFKTPYWYYTRTVEGQNYPIYCRRMETMEALEEEYLNINLIKDQDYLDIGSTAVSPNHKVLAYSLDTAGDEIYKILFKSLDTNEPLSDVIENSDGSVVWNKDNSAVFYLTRDNILRPSKLWRHELGTPATADVLLYDNTDEQFWTSMGKSASGRFLMVSLGSSLTSEVHVLDLENESAGLKCFNPREFRHQYEVEHQGDHFYILTDAGGKFLNKKLQRVGIADTSQSLWEDVIPYDPFRELCDISPFEKFIIIEERTEGMRRLRVLDPADPVSSYLIPFEDDIFLAETASSKVQIYNSDVVRFVYTSQLTPTKTLEYNVVSRETKLLKQRPVPGGFDPKPYTLKQVHVPIPRELQVNAPFDTPVPDKIPMTLLYKTDAFRGDGQNKCYLYGYGSYGIALEPNFSSDIFSYVDRGIVVAWAHIRGGGELGRGWYETGKFLHKKNTFLDFVACAEYLVNNGISKHELMAIEGRSAGGLLMGAVLNLKPDIAVCALAGVPFVDVINTMMDETIPLTVNEYEEWGNPNDQEYFDYMISYSPYDNIKAGVKSRIKYPNMFVKAGINDPRVQYWEPAKWVAKLRASDTQGVTGPDPHVLVFDCKLGSGHFGASGRYAYLKEKAGEYVFVINQLEVAAKRIQA
ncbi:peptidase S9A prolyl oligopeptidase domain protein beta-propeller [Chytriomyces sp. MP71]|nr:peptidase S9A prolyl oligopeptidase domain protein beta-propeller [Chytriomyces sp. MP71]